MIRGGVFTWNVGEVGSGMNRGENRPVPSYITVFHNSHHSLLNMQAKASNM